MSYWYEDFDKLLPYIMGKRDAIPEKRGTAASWPYETVQYSIQGEIAYVKLADMRNSNGLTSKTTVALEDICLELYERPDVKVVLFTAGGKYFCTGGAFAANDPLDAKYGAQSDPFIHDLERASGGNQVVGMLLALMMNLPQFKVASIRGENMGAGNSLIASMDYVVSPRNNCSLHFMEVRRGVAACPTWQGVFSKLGAGAKTWTLIGAEMFPEEAFNAGIVQALADDMQSSDAVARTKAEELAKLPMEQLHAMKTTGHYAKKPLMKMPPAIKELDTMQMENPDYLEVVPETIEATGRTGRIPEARLSKSMWPHETVKFEKKGQQMMVLTLANPEGNNAITSEMLDGLLDAVIEIHKSVNKVRVLEIRAEGDYFCSGLDKNSDLDPEQVERFLFLFYMLPLCTVGIVNGKVAGFGTLLCSAIDHVYASSTNATFDFSGVKEDKYCEFLRERVRNETAFEELLTNAGKANSAEDMKAIKVVTKVFSNLQEADGLLEATCKLIKESAPNGVADQKAFIARACTRPLSQENLWYLASHIGKRMTFDLEFSEAIKGLLMKGYKPLYTRSEVGPSPPAKLMDASDLI